MLHGHVYSINSRNLVVGVWDEFNNYFIGVRHKWGDCHLDIERHRDATPGGTAREVAELCKLPEGVSVVESFGMYDSLTNRLVHFDSKQWLYSDTGLSVDDCSAIYVKSNKELLEFLVPLDTAARAGFKKEWEDHVRKVAEIRQRGDGA